MHTYSQASGLVHHDLSAANVMLQYKAGGGSSQIEPYVKLVDYGCMYTPATYADGIDSKGRYMRTCVCMRMYMSVCKLHT